MVNAAVNYMSSIVVGLHPKYDILYLCFTNFIDLKKIFSNPGNIYLFKVKIGNIKKRCEMCSKLTIQSLAPLWCLYC